MLEKINLKTVDGVTIVGDHYKGPHGSPGILLLHMMPSDRKSWTVFATKLNEASFGVLSIDLRGHGESDGGPDGYKDFSDEEHQKSIEDVKVGVLYQKNEGHNPQWIAGASIGANLALQCLTELRDIKKVILLSPGINYKGIETLSFARQVESDKGVYIVAAKDDVRSGGSADQMAEEIYKALNCKKEIKIFETGRHGTDILDAHPDFIDVLVNWLK